MTTNMPSSRYITIRFRSVCQGCHREIKPGERGYLAKGYGVRCLDCGPHPAGAVPLSEQKKQAAGLSDQDVARLRERLSAGERITKLGTETGVPWQKLWGILKAGKPGKAGRPVPRPHQQPDNGNNAAFLGSDGVHRYEITSVGDAVRDALSDYAQSAHNQEFIHGRLKEALSGKDPWAGRYTEAKFLAELADPKKELLEAVDEMRAKLVDEVAVPSMPRRRIRHGQEYGEELDVDRWLRYDLNPWDRNVREEQARRTVTIGCNLAANANVKSWQTLYRGAAALALADILTQRGVNVEIVLFDSVRYPTDAVVKGVVKYTVKEHQMPLDIGAVAFAMCEVAWFRVVGALGGSRHWPGKISEGLGSAASLPEAEKKSCDYLIEKSVLSKEDAEQWLRTCLAQQESEVTHV